MTIVNPYDKAHELARALTSCDQYKSLEKALQALRDQPEAEEKLAAFMQKQMEFDFQQAQQGGQEVDARQIEELEAQYQELLKEQVVADFIGAERAFMQIYGDIQQILQRAITPED